MDKSDIYYTLYLLVTVFVYRSVGFIFSLVDLNRYLVFFGAEIQVIAVTLITIYYNCKENYSGVVTLTISLIIMIYGFVELRFGAFYISNSNMVSLMHWSLGLIIGTVVLQAIRKLQNG
jgi:hypothetical protein